MSALAAPRAAYKVAVIGAWFRLGAGAGRVHFAIDAVSAPRRVIFACGRAPRLAEATPSAPVGGEHCESCIRAVNAAMRPAIGCAA